MKKYNTSIGFTLAEVLITLGIIGVVAALTIPTLMNSYQNTQYIVGLKKAYSQFNQVLKQISMDKGCVNDLKCSGLFATGTNNATLGTELVNYFKVVKNCGIVTGEGCFPSNTYYNLNYDGSATDGTRFDYYGYYKFITEDGMIYAINNFTPAYSADCGENWSTGKLGNMVQTCGEIYIDVNGPKGPNTYGRDTFQFLITNGKGALLYPVGGIDDNIAGWWKNGNNCSATNPKGWYCSGRIIEEGWQMNY